MRCHAKRESFVAARNWDLSLIDQGCLSSVIEEVGERKRVSGELAVAVAGVAVQSEVELVVQID